MTPEDFVIEKETNSEKDEEPISFTQIWLFESFGSFLFCFGVL